MLEGCCRCRVCRCCCGGCVVGVVGGIVAVVSCMVYWIFPPKEAGKTEEKRHLYQLQHMSGGFTVTINENILWDIRYIIYDTNGFGRDVRGLYSPKNSNSGTPAIVNGLVEDKIAPKTMDIV